MASSDPHAAIPSPRSWNHRISRMPFDQETRLEKAGWTCSAPRCEGHARWNAAYDYVTGRAGRVSWAERRLCDEHAEKFAAKYGLELVDEAVRSPRGGSGRLFDELRGVDARQGTTAW